MPQDNVNTHHLWWPARDYKTKLEKQFRELPCQKVRIDLHAHCLLHLSPSPNKPTTADMLAAVKRHLDFRCSCPRE